MNNEQELLRKYKKYGIDSVDKLIELLLKEKSIKDELLNLKENKPISFIKDNLNMNYLDNFFNKNIRVCTVH